MARFNWFAGEKLDLADKESLLIGKLVIISAILQEFGQKFEQSFPVIDQYSLHSDRFIRIGDKHFKDVEPFILHHFSVVSQEVHASFEVIAAIHIRCHDIVIGAVKKNLSQQFNALSLCHVGFRLNEDLVVFAKEEAIVGGQVGGDQCLVARQKVLCVSQRVSLGKTC